MVGHVWSAKFACSFGHVDMARQLNATFFGRYWNQQQALRVQLVENKCVRLVPPYQSQILKSKFSKSFASHATHLP